MQTLHPPPETREAAPRQGKAATQNANQSQRNFTLSKPIGKQQTTLGSSLFFDPLAGAGGIADIRQRLELKYCAAVATGGANGFPLDVRRIKDPRLRALAGAGMTLKNWTVQDLVECGGSLTGHAASVLITTLEKSDWGPDDVRLMGAIESLEGMRNMALGGGRTL
jgi:hypothetical protein